MGTIVSAQNVTKIYQMDKVHVVALDGVSFSIDEGEFVAIMGPSGSGKSTLMNLIGCLDKPTSGTISIDGTDISRLNDRQLARLRGSQIGFVFQTFNLIPRIDALANVMLPMTFTEKIPPKQRRARAQQLLEIVGLGQRLHHLPSELSGGERQRVAIARALANDPKILLADEPTGNLDTKTGKTILELFVELNKGGRTVVVVTHDADGRFVCPKNHPLARRQDRGGRESMSFREALKLSWTNIRAHKLRNALAVLSVTIGIAAVIAIVTMTTGLQDALLDTLTKDLLRANMITVNVEGSAGLFGTAQVFSSRDVEQLRTIAGVKTVDVIGRVRGDALYFKNRRLLDATTRITTSRDLIPVDAGRGVQAKGEIVIGARIAEIICRRIFAGERQYLRERRSPQRRVQEPRHQARACAAHLGTVTEAALSRH
jgi:putative ABC transport system ATP-binding protein